MSLTCGGFSNTNSTLALVVQGKREKHARICKSHGFDFLPFGLPSLVSFWHVVKERLSCIFQCYSSHPLVPSWEAHYLVFKVILLGFEGYD